MSAKALDKSQVDKFREAARELGTDESEANFDALVKKIANTPAPKQDRAKQGAKVTSQNTK